jgi:hypothetical protein
MDPGPLVPPGLLLLSNSLSPAVVTHRIATTDPHRNQVLAPLFGPLLI